MQPVPPCGRCAACGYDLRDLPQPRCPECGLAFGELDNQPSSAPARRRRALVPLVLGLTIGLVCAKCGCDAFNRAY